MNSALSILLFNYLVKGKHNLFYIKFFFLIYNLRIFEIDVRAAWLWKFKILSIVELNLRFRLVFIQHVSFDFFNLIINFKNFWIVSRLFEFQVFFFVRDIWVCILKQFIKVLWMIIEKGVFICRSNRLIFFFNVCKLSQSISFELFHELLITMRFFVVIPARLFCSFNRLDFLFQ